MNSILRNGLKKAQTKAEKLSGVFNLVQKEMASMKWKGERPLRRK